MPSSLAFGMAACTMGVVEDRETFTLNLDPELKERLRFAAYKHRRSMAKITCEGIALALDQLDNQTREATA